MNARIQGSPSPVTSEERPSPTGPRSGPVLPGIDPLLPRAQGLYDPRTSTIPAASASSPT